MRKTFAIAIVLIISTLMSAQKVTVDYNARQQRINMIGTDMERSAAFIQKAADPLEVCQWCFGDIPYKAVRVPYDKKQEMTEGAPNLAYYDDIIASMKMARQVNPDIDFYATMKSDYNGYGDENNLPDWICDYKPTTYFYVDKYVDFLADYLQLMNDNGVAITYMTVAKEWVGVVTPARTVEIIEGLKTELTTRNVPVPKFTDPSGWSTWNTKNFVNSIVALGKQDLFYAFSTHHYNNTQSGYPAFITACKSAETYAWNDESGYGNGGRTNGVEPETIDAILGTYATRAYYYDEGLEGELFFEICSRGVSSETRSVYFTSGSEAKRMRAYYVGKHFAENVYQRYYVSGVKSNLNSDVSTMAFVSADEIALWLVNNGDTDFSSVELDIENASISGDVLHYAYSADNKIQGDMTEVLPSGGKYSIRVAPNTVNYVEIRLKEQSGTSDVITLEQESLDFGTVGSSDLADAEQLLYVKVDNPSTDVTLSLSGTHASAFSIAENATIKQSPMVWYVPVKFKFNPASAGTYQATITVNSGTESESVTIRGEAYMTQVAGMPFVDDFPGLVSGTLLDNNTLNSFTAYSGWTVEGGVSSGNDRLKIQSTGNPDAHISTPDIEIDGPFELKFNARMLLNEQGSTDAERDENDLARNFYAIVEDDTIYDHHKAGSTFFQNYNQWKCTYHYSGTTKVRFVAEVGTSGVWSGKTDGLIFGPGSDAVRVQSTSLPAVNIGFGHRIDYGEVLPNTLNDMKYNFKGVNLSENLYLSTDDTKVTMNRTELQPSGGTLDVEAILRVNTTGLSEGEYTSTVTLTGENTQIKTRTITLAYKVVNALSVNEVLDSDMLVVGMDNALEINVDKPRQVCLYDMSGVLLHQCFLESYARFEMKPGIYLVASEGLVRKVVVF